MRKNTSGIKRAYAGQACHKETGKIHEAHELEKLGYGRNDRWICVDERCGAEMTACAWFEKNPPFKRSPYFRVNGSHTDECFVAELEQLAKKGSINRLSDEQGFPVPYPSKLIFSGQSLKIQQDSSICNAESGTSNGKEIIPVVPIHKWHNRTLRTIWMACQFYVDFPHDRHLLFEVQGCEGQTYDEVFVGSARAQRR